MRRIALTAALLAGCSAEDSQGGTTCHCTPPIDPNYNIIALLPLTGPGARTGPEHLRAIQKGVADLESAGGLDRRITLHVIDAAVTSIDGNAERLAAQLDELTTADGARHVAAILTSTTDALTAAAPVALAERIPLFEISSGVGLDELMLPPGADRHYANALRPLCMPEPGVTAQLLAQRTEQAGWQRVFVVRGSQAHDRTHTRELRVGLAALGKASVIVNPVDVEMSNVGPFESYIDQAIAANAEVIYYHLDGDAPNLAFLQAAERQGFTGKIVTCGMARTSALLDAVDPGIAPYLSGGSATEGRLVFAMRGPVPGAGYDAFRTDFKTFSGFDADAFSPAGYDAAVLIGIGIAAAGTGEPASQAAITASASGGQNFGYGELAAALQAAKAGVDIDLDGASGPLDLTYDDVQGNRAVGRYYFESLVQRGPEEYAYAELTSPVEVR